MAPVMLPVQARSPVALVTVQPVEDDPPPTKISPVPVLFRFNAPVPLASIEKAILVSPPVAARVGVPVVAALVMVSSLTALAAVPNLSHSLPLASKISAPLICKSSVRMVLVPVLSMVKLPEESTVKLL